MMSKKLSDLAVVLRNVRHRNPEPNFQLGISYTAHAVADDQCTGSERLHFLLASGTPFTL